MPKAKDAPAVGDVADVVVEQTPEEAKAAQLEGFVEADTSTATPAKTEKSAEEIAQEDAAATKAAEEARVAQEAEAAAAAQAEADKPVIAGYTAAQLTAALDKAKQYDGLKSSLDKVNGKFGSIEQRLAQMSEAKPANVQLTDEDVADLKEEYGPELAGALLKTLNKFGAKIGGAVKEEKSGQATPEDAQAKIEAAVKAAKAEVDAELASSKQELELRLLTREHKDWKSLVQGEPLKNADGTVQVDSKGRPIMGAKPEFTAWVKTLPEADQKKLETAWDADYLSETLTNYKKHIATQKAAADASAAAAKHKATPARVSAAVTSRGVPGSVAGKSALDEQKEGYASA